MTKRGDLFLQDGLVVAIEPGAAKGCRIVVETDEPISTKVSGTDQPGTLANPIFKTQTLYLTAEQWAEVERDFGGSDMLLARRVAIADLLGSRVLGRTAAVFAALGEDVARNRAADERARSEQNRRASERRHP